MENLEIRSRDLKTIKKLSFGMLVSCETHINGEDMRGRLFYLTGAKRVSDKCMLKYEGIWSLTEVHTEKHYPQVLGCDLHVWGIVSTPEERAKLKTDK